VNLGRAAGKPVRRRWQARILLRGLAGAIAWGLAPAVAGPNTPAPTNSASFIRFEATGRDEGRVQTAITTYARVDGVAVSLIAAVHVGDRAYYDRLQQLFTNYDALLYEMIRDRDDPAPAVAQADHPVSQLQIGLKSLLDLEFQLDRIDYAKTNFVHADLDPATFARLQKEKGETILGLLLRVALEEEARQREPTDSSLESLQFLLALFHPNRAHHLKLLLGRQMDRIENMLAGIEDDQGTVLVRGRNEHALRVLQDQIRRGRKKLALFYGAGHMPDFAQQLEQAGFKKIAQRWETAWDIRRQKPIRQERPSPPPAR
jgi:hypothetical protein